MPDCATFTIDGRRRMMRRPHRVLGVYGVRCLWWRDVGDVVEGELLPGEPGATVVGRFGDRWAHFVRRDGQPVTWQVDEPIGSFCRDASAEWCRELWQWDDYRDTVTRYAPRIEERLTATAPRLCVVYFDPHRETAHIAERDAEGTLRIWHSEPRDPGKVTCEGEPVKAGVPRRSIAWPMSSTWHKASELLAERVQGEAASSWRDFEMRCGRLRRGRMTSSVDERGTFM